MATAVKNNEIDIEGKLRAFDEKIKECKRFEILGVDYREEGDYFIVEDTARERGTEGSCIEVPVSEVITKPLDSVLKVMANERPEIVCKGYTRIVGYYSAVHNWNQSKVGEQADRVKGRLHGAYGFNGQETDYGAYNDALKTLDSLSKNNISGRQVAVA